MGSGGQDAMDVPRVLYQVSLQAVVQIRRTRHQAWRACVDVFHSCQFRIPLRLMDSRPSPPVSHVSFLGPRMNKYHEILKSCNGLYLAIQF